MGIELDSLAEKAGSTGLRSRVRMGAAHLQEEEPGSMIRKFGILSAAALAVLAGAAWAEPVKPDAVVIEDMMISESLTGKPGDPAKGREVFANRKLGNCLACHVNSDQSEQLFHGDVGPSLDGVADRWSEAEIRAIVVNSKAVFSDETVMPGFYSLKVGLNPTEAFAGKTILTAEEVEDVVAYLTTLKE